MGEQSGAKFNPPKWVKHPLAPAVSFLIVTIWAQTLDVRDDLRTALLLFSIIFALAIACGLLFGARTGVSRRVWCRHLCPIGSVLGVFSRLGVMSLESANKNQRVEGYRDQGYARQVLSFAASNLHDTALNVPAASSQTHVVA